MLPLRFDPASRRHALAAWAVALVPIVAVVALLVVKKLHGPLIDAEDTNQYEFCGFYLGEHLHWTPLPTMSFMVDDVFYPYGTNAVFQPWVLERDLLFAALSRSFGPGPWLAFYMLASFCVAALGSAMLLHRDFGFARASVVGFTSGFASYYAVHKYPLQISLCTTHWTLLGMVADFVLLHRAWRGRALGAHLVTLRVALLFLALGQELGYVAGLSYTSFALTLPVGLVLLVRSRRLRPSLFTGGAAELARRPVLTAGALLLLAVGAFVYFPLALGIVRAARALGDVPSGGSWWAHPARLLDPWLPFVHPASAGARTVFGRAEGIGEGSPGVFLVGVAVLGVVDAIRRREATPALPLLAFFALAIPYHPESFPTLKLLPWFSFHRVGGRTTLAYALACALLGLRAPWQEWFSRSPRLVSAFALLGLLELGTAYGVHATRFHPTSRDARFDRFMQTVRETPGEAVLDWPFCVAGGNGVGNAELCPYYFRNNTVYANQRFHGKKVMGQYFGRLAESQVSPYRRAGWPSLFVPEAPGFPNSARQARCFDDQEWRFFRAFFAKNDFAGINVYVDLLPTGCPESIYERLGAPIAETVIVGAGRVTFVPKPAAMRAEVDAAAGRGLAFERTSLAP